jgi:hypothetical protein
MLGVRSPFNAVRIKDPLTSSVQIDWMLERVKNPRLSAIPAPILEAGIGFDFGGFV